MAAHSPSPSPVVSRKSQDSDLVVYAGEHRYELYKPDNETLIFSFPVPSGLTMKDLDFSCTGVSVSCRLKKSSAPPFLEGKLWSSLRPGADPPIITFEEQKSGRTLVIEFNISSGVQWPVLIGRPLNADAESIDPWSAYLLASVLERPSATMPANPIEAFAFFKNAARRGVAEAQYRLGQIYSNHIDAVMCGAGLDRRLAVTYFLAVAKVRSIGSHSQFTT
ncbi:MAG: hypothetical protein Q8P67_23710, partial [archaeon]|nr:hypothetical protein [archaeon]